VFQNAVEDALIMDVVIVMLVVFADNIKLFVVLYCTRSQRM